MSLKYAATPQRMTDTEFKRASKILLDRGKATEGDFVTLAAYSEVYARWRESKAEVIGKFMIDTTIKDSNGVMKVVTRLNPLIKGCEAAESRVLQLASKLGLTPADRDRVKPTKAKLAVEVIPGSMLAAGPTCFASYPLIGLLPKSSKIEGVGSSCHRGARR